MSDLNGYGRGWLFWLFHQPGEYGGTSSFYNKHLLRIQIH
jgi:hypothetical protein